jgi:hypothetical protein
MNLEKINNERGSIGSGVLLWMLGVPLPVILLISMMRGC